VSEVKVVAEEQFGELLAAVKKVQADVMLFLEEKEQAALNQANSIKTHLEYRSAEMEKSEQELARLAAISNTVLFLEVQRRGRVEATMQLLCGAPLLHQAQDTSVNGTALW
jgi:hypothetical protein